MISSFFTNLGIHWVRTNMRSEVTFLNNFILITFIIKSVPIRVNCELNFGGFLEAIKNTKNRRKIKNFSKHGTLSTSS